MTRQYLAGELSVLLGQLQAIDRKEGSVRGIARLRYEAETCPSGALSSVAVRALLLSDELCWESLTSGDAVAFSREAAISAELLEFGVCAGLLGED
ncbi:MAG TPA: hypothetical protein VG034_12675 [Acidimicrobiia bacterium]|jgi:hypothetical protein|nr:hypothetical protein [Acidimicrobiia bacterium]